MKIATLKVRSENGNEFEEVYNEGQGRRPFNADDDIEAWAKDIIEYWNETLRPHEHCRHLIAVTITDEETLPLRPDHEWVKVNLVTLESRGRYFDKMACTTCGITGRRYGLSFVKRDAQFKAKKYERCGGSIS